MNLDETVGVNWVVATMFVHGRLLLVVQFCTISTSNTAFNNSVTLVELELDVTIDVALGEGKGVSQELALGREVLTIVEDTAKGEGDVLVTESTKLTIKSQAFKIDVGSTEDSATGGFVAAAGLDTDESRFNNINTANTISASNSVEISEEFNGLSDSSAIVVVDNLDGNTLLESDGDTLGSVGSVFGIDGQFPHILGGSCVWVFKDTSLVRDVEQVLIGRPRLSSGLDNGNALLSSISQEITTTLEAFKEFYTARNGLF